jgi:eukaryotic-like serine/threonine-protein kinase
VTDSSSDFAVNTVLQGRYRLGELLGQGGMALVYRARDELLGRDVAVKIFQASAENQAEIARQENELTVLAGLNHHSLVTLLDAGVDLTDPAQPHLYLVMELVEGADLTGRLDQGVLSLRQTAEVGFDLAEGLEYLHSRGVVHRDVKPANVLMVEYRTGDTRLRAKLTDFGIARLSDSARLTPGGLTTGTAAYLSPEQVQRAEASPASDVYALGLLLLECLTGELAYPGQPVQSALARIQKDPSMPADLDPAMRELLSAMTARDPGERPSAREVALALREITIKDAGRHRVVSADPAADESARMDAVHRYEILDTPPDGAFDRITALAARAFSAPIAIVSVVDHDRIWFKSHHGLDLDQIDREPGLCASAILNEEAWIVEDARQDLRTLANPLVAGEFGLQFYAGVPLTTQDGFNLGTLCVLDFEPRPVTDAEVATLHDLAAVVMSELELRLESRRLRAQGIAAG